MFENWELTCYIVYKYNPYQVPENVSTSTKNPANHTADFSICPCCDLLLEQIDCPPDQIALCPRCRCRLHKPCPDSIVRSLALACTGLLLYIPANFFPLLTFNVLGTNASSSLFTSTLSMFDQHQPLVGIIVVLTGFIFPLLTLSLLFWVSAGLYFNWQVHWMTGFMRWYQHLTEWAMTDVYLIGVFITIIKMSHTAKIHFDVGFFCFVGLVIITVAAQTSVDKPLFWERMGKKGEKPEGKKKVTVPVTASSGKEAGLLLCHVCHKVIPLTDLAPEKKPLCPRCSEPVHLRKQNSISRSWALVICAAILTLPANLLPIMSVAYLGNPDASTIMDGIIYFFKEGSYGIGAIILTASVLVPLFKIFGMSLILLSIHYQWQSWNRHKSLMFRFIEFVGRWSMLDIFVITLLCALVQFGKLSTVDAAPAAFYFTGVVLCTMFAAISFDPRLLWDGATDRST
jgi:paraquat-inducible protein A